MLMGKGPFFKQLSKLRRKTEIRKCHCKTRHSQQKYKSNQSVKVLKTLRQDKGQSFCNNVEHDLLA